MRTEFGNDVMFLVSLPRAYVAQNARLRSVALLF